MSAQLCEADFCAIDTLACFGSDFLRTRYRDNQPGAAVETMAISIFREVVCSNSYMAHAADYNDSYVFRTACAAVFIL